jgi:hypothetical protein
MIWKNLRINIQYKVGDVRSGTDANGKTWTQRCPFDYGEISGSKGMDNEPVDVIFGPFKQSKKVFICTLPKSKSGEEKVMLGFLTLASAKKGFIAFYGGDISFFKSIKSIGLTQLKSLLKLRRGMSFFANEVTAILQPIPTGYFKKVKEVEPDEEDIKLSLKQIMRQGGNPSYATTSMGWDQNQSPTDLFY